MSSPSNPGRWQVQRERLRLDESDRLYPPYMDGRVQDIVPQLVRRLGLADTYWEHTLEREWPALVGEQVAKHTRPGRMNRGVLYVYVSSAPWLAELSRMGQKQILENVQKRFGESRIKSVRLQPDPDPPSPKRYGGLTPPPARTGGGPAGAMAKGYRPAPPAGGSATSPS